MSHTKKILALLVVLTSGSAYAQSHSENFSVKPNRCIALHQGQACYVTLRFKWKTPEAGDYCLFDERRETPLICWTGNTMASYRHNFEAKRNVAYQIREKQSQRSVSQTLVKISWVYKSNNRSTSRWRLF